MPSPFSEARPRPTQVRALLFDLGGVVIDVDFRRAFAHWEAISALSAAEMASLFSVDAVYEQHERGEITGETYFAHLRQLLQLQDRHDHIAEGWNRILIGEIEQTLRMIALARANVPCFAFSNSNATHQASWRARFPAMEGHFDHVFVSSDIGHRKPERAAFEHIGRALGVPLDAILFFDDLADNVAGASAAGLQSVLVRGPADVEAALLSLGCLLPNSTTGS